MLGATKSAAEDTPVTSSPIGLFVMLTGPISRTLELSWTMAGVVRQTDTGVGRAADGIQSCSIALDRRTGRSI